MVNDIKVFKQEAHKPLQSREYPGLYTDFLSEGLVVAYEHAHHRINKNEIWQNKTAL